MKPQDFLLFDRDSSPNTPSSEINEALQKPITILTETGPMIVLSYYYDKIFKRMVLELKYDYTSTRG